MALKIRIRSAWTGSIRWSSLLLRSVLLAIAAVALVGFSSSAISTSNTGHRRRAAQAAHLRQHRKNLCRAARGPSRPKALRLASSPMNCARPATPPMVPRQPSPLGTYSEGAQSITVHPGPQSYHAPDSATIHVSGGVVDSITDDHGQPLSSYELEPLLITGLSDERQPHQAPPGHLRRDSARTWSRP